MMTLEKFAEAVSSEVAKRLGAGFHVHVLKPVINNGIVQTQLCIEKEGQQFRPSIHLKDFLSATKKEKGFKRLLMRFWNAMHRRQIYRLVCRRL